MTKKKIVMLALFAVLYLLAYSAWSIAASLRPAQTKIPHAESKIMITFARGGGGAGTERTEEVDDPQDAAFLFALFGKQHTAVFDTPSCPFDWCRISFVRGRERIDFHPAMDGCGLVRYRGKFLDITPEEAGKLMEIHHKYYKKQ